MKNDAIENFTPHSLAALEKEPRVCSYILKIYEEVDGILAGEGLWRAAEE